jgi:hypothetical protein
MRFRTGELTFTASIVDAGQLTSPQTGAPLRAFTIQFRVPKPDQHALLVEAAQQRSRGGLFSLTDDDEPDAEWRVCESGFAYIGSEPWGVHHHTWHLEEIEPIACTRLVLGSIELEPYDYREQVGDDGRLRLAVRTAVSDADLRVVSELHQSQAAVEVVRVGISQEPRRMRLVQYAWGERGDALAVVLACAELGTLRVALDSTPPPPAPTDSFDDLLSLLEQKGLLSQQEQQLLLDSRRERDLAARHVANPDAWPL